MKTIGIRSTLLFAGLGLLMSLATAANADLVHYSHTFDGDNTNDSTPALDGYTNGVGNSSYDLALGTLTNSGTAASGFVSTMGFDLTAFSEFTVEYVATSSFTSVENTGANGSFFGITTSPGTYATGPGQGGTLWNNNGSATSPAVGLQAGPNRGAAGLDLAIDAGGNANGDDFIDLLADPTEDGTNGYTISVTYADAGNGTTDVTIETMGLSADISVTNNINFSYATLAANVAPNISTQGGIVDLDSIQVYTAMAVPEPSSAALSLSVLVILGCRRRRNP